MTQAQIIASLMEIVMDSCIADFTMEEQASLIEAAQYLLENGWVQNSIDGTWYYTNRS